MARTVPTGIGPGAGRRLLPRARLATALITALLACGIAPASAQSQYPTKPVTLVLATAAGGVADAVARILDPIMAKELGQPVVIDNRPGAAGVIGTAAVAKAAPDGYTVLFNLEMHVINQVAAPHLQYDALKDFAPVSLVAELPHMIAVPTALKISSLKDFVALAKSKPGKLNYGTPGRLTSTYLETEEFMARSGINMLQVPYKGGPPVVQGLIRNDVQFAILSLPPFRGAIDAGAITPIAVTGPKRLPEMPKVPTMIESGYPDFVAHTWIGAFVPAKTPPAIIKKLNGAIAAAMKDPKTRATLIRIGFEPVASTPEELGALVKREVDHWSSFIKEHHITFK